MIVKVIDNFLRSDYVRNILRLFSGTSLSQLIPILISPILTRLYTAEQFGFFATYVSAYTLLSVLSTGRYDQAIILLKPNQSLNAILTICFGFLIAFTVFLEGAIILVKDPLSQFLKLEEYGFLVFLIPVSVFLMGSIQINNYLIIKNSLFTRLSYLKISQTFLVNGITIVLGLIALGIGLIVGQMVGMMMISAILIFWLFYKFDFKPEYNWQELKRVLKEYQNFPKYDIPATFFSTGTPQSIVLLLGIFFSSTIVGVYALTNRVLLAPIFFVSKSIVDVFREKASRDYHETGSCRGIYVKTLLLLTTISIIPFTVLFFYGDVLFSLIFGEEWELSGQIAMILTPMYMLKFVSSPLSYVLYIAGKQRLNLVYQFTLFASIIAALFLGEYLGDYLSVFKLISLCYSIFYGLFLIQSYRFTISREIK